MTFEIFRNLPASRAQDEDRKLVSFSVGSVLCGIDIMRVKEIVNPQETVPVPSAPGFIVGASDHRSAMVPVVDLCKRMDLTPEESIRPKWVIVDAEETDIALLVDLVHGVISVSGDDERKKHPVLEGANAKWIKSVFSRDGELVFELDISSVAGIEAVLESIPAPVEEAP